LDIPNFALHGLKQKPQIHITQIQQLLKFSSCKFNPQQNILIGDKQKLCRITIPLKAQNKNLVCQEIGICLSQNRHSFQSINFSFVFFFQQAAPGSACLLCSQIEVRGRDEPGGTRPQCPDSRNDWQQG
jgi:hypothetical protein